jgi:DUF4097 and DUF4098 domain-containing protein YvlB
MATTSALEARITEQLDPIFADFKATSALAELRAEVTSNLVAAAIDKIAAGSAVDVAVTEAIAEFGDIKELATELAAEDETTSEPDAPVTTTPHAKKHTDVTTNDDAGNIEVDGKVVGVDITPDEAVAATGHKFSVKTNDDVKPQNEMRQALAGVREVQVNYAHDDIRIVPIDGTELQVSETFHNYKPEYAGHITRDGDLVRVLNGHRPHSTLRINVAGFKLGFWSRITIGVPASFKGKLLVKAKDGDVSAANLRELTGVNISAGDGDVQLVYLAVQQLAVTTDDGDLTLRGSQADETMLSSHDGDLMLEQSAVGTLAARTDDGNINANNLNVTGNAQLVTRDGDAHVNTVRAANLAVTSNDGALQVSNLAAEAIALKTGDGDVHAGDLSGTVTLQTGDGDVHAHWQKVTGDITVSTGDGDVDIQLPQYASYDFDLHAGDGHIHQPEDNVTFTKNVKHRRRGTKGDQPTFTLIAGTGDGDLRIQ